MLVTGGARRLGFMLGGGFVRAGARVFITSRKSELCHSAAGELATAGSCTALPADISSPAGRESLATELSAHTSQLDVLVNNAGATWGAALDDYPVEAFDKVWSVNVSAIFHLTQMLLPQLRAAAAAGDPARIINIGSVNGTRVPYFENYAYSSSKAGVHMLTQHLASRLAREQITVNAIAPGFFETNMTRFLVEDDAARAETVGHVPMGRLGESRDIAGLALLLAGPSATWITGAIIPLDGGMQL